MKIFISYRRSDAADVAGRIFDRLKAAFGADSVFKDVDSIPIGADFEEAIVERLSDCDAVLVIIGQTWASVARQDGVRRLDDPADFVRIEVEQALHHRIPLIPALVGNADMPVPNQLPESIRKLTRRNAIAIRPDPDFHRDMDRLIQGLQKQREQKARSPATNQPGTTREKPIPVAVAVVEGGDRQESRRSPPEEAGKFPLAQPGSPQTETAAYWFLLAGISNLAMAASLIAGALVFGMGFLALFCVGVLGPAAACHFLASGSVKNCRGKAKIITAIIVGLGLGLLFSVYAMGAIIVITRFSMDISEPKAFIFLLSLASLVAAFINVRAAIRGVLVLKDPAMGQEFGRPGSANDEPRPIFSKKQLITLAGGLVGWFLLCLLLAHASQPNMGPNLPNNKAPMKK